MTTLLSLLKRLTKGGATSQVHQVTSEITNKSAEPQSNAVKLELAPEVLMLYAIEQGALLKRRLDTNYPLPSKLTTKQC